MTFDDVRAMALAWPLVIDRTPYGTSALKVGSKLLTRLREDSDILVVKGVEIDERAMLIEVDRAVFLITDHYRDYPIVLVRLSAARPEVVRSLLPQSWRTLVPKQVLRAFESKMQCMSAKAHCA
jgi:hypothetical protein